jgi:PAS domain S-box-containing protein
VSPISATENGFPALPPAGQHAYILQQIEDVIVTANLDFEICSLNAVASRYFGFSAEEAMGRRMADFVSFEYSDDEPLDAIKAKLALAGRWQGELSFVSKTGKHHYFWFTLSFLPGTDGTPDGILVIGRDRTAEREAELSVLRKERFYHGLIAGSLDGILLMDDRGRINFASPSIKHVLGYDYYEVLGHQGFEYVHPDDRERAAQAFMLEVEQNAEYKFINIRLRRKDGEWLWCLVRGNNLLNNPSVNGIAIYFHDDTLRKKATEALKESEQRFRMLIQHIQLGVVLMNREGIVTLCNETAAKLLGLPMQQLLGMNVMAASWGAISESGEVVPMAEYPVPVAIQTRKPVRNVVLGIMNGGQRLWLLLNAEPLLDDNGELHHVICSFADITDRKNLEEQLLAEQIAHQRQLTQATIDSSEVERTEIGKELHDNIGQQLTTIKLYLDLAKSTADEETLEMVALANRNISDVINEIRSLCRSLIPSTLGDLGLKESINDLIHTITRTQQLRIRYSGDAFEEGPVPDNQKLMLFRILQEQLNNIVKHAAARRVDIILESNEAGITLKVTDDGRGFNPATVRRGLGLTNMSNRAEMFGGTVDVRSAPGEGCTLTVKVPLREE